MKLKEYLNRLKQMVKENPDIKDYDVISASDDEGNYHEPVVYSPTVGRFDHKDGEFNTEDKLNANSICIN